MQHIQLNFPFVSSDEIEEKLRELLEFRSLTLAAAANELGLTRKRVWDLAERYGVNRWRRQRAKNHREEIYQMRLAGHSCHEIAKRFGCAVRTVQSICKDWERHQQNFDLGVHDDGPFTRQVWGESDGGDDDSPREVKPYRCPVHGLVKFRPCIACMATKN